MGLAAMLGTGVFAAWTPALLWSGPLLLVSLAVAAVVAALNAWSTASLARVHPEAGGAYAYGRARLGRGAGVVAGAAFVLGKVASAGAAALTLGSYLWAGHERLVAVVAIAALLVLDLFGVTRTAAASAVSVVLVVVVLVAVVVASTSYPSYADAVVQPASPGPAGVLAAAGLLFVAFAGYARVATLGEEVRDPERTLPRAIAVALGTVMVVYLAVGVAVLRVEGPIPADERSPAPLVQLVHLVATPSFDAATGNFAPAPWGAAALVVPWVRIAAAVAAGGALLSLLAGVGRTLFAMGRGGDAPGWLTPVSRHGVPHRAQVVAAVAAAVVSLVGGIGGALAVSGTSILLYYGVAHLAALRMRADEPRAPRAVPLLGLVGCVLVASSLVAVGLGLLSPGA